MTHEDDFIQQLEGYLDEYEGTTPLPDAVRDAVRAQLRTTRQIGPASGLMRNLIMDNNIVRVGLVAAAAVIIAVIAFNLLPGSPAPGGEQTPTPDPSAAAAATATPLPALDDQDPLEPGRYQVNAGPTIDVTVAVPSGWSANGDWVVLGPRGNDEPDGMAIRFYAYNLNLYTNPASPDEGQLDPPVGPTVDDLVEAIVAHPAWVASEPTDIAIDGSSGQLVSITIPSDAEFTSSDEFFLFVEPGGGQVWGWAPGQTFDLYIVDVDGVRLVIDSFHYPGTSEDDLSAQREVVDSVEASLP